jgi:hypothetical protein
MSYLRRLLGKFDFVFFTTTSVEGSLGLMKFSILFICFFVSSMIVSHAADLHSGVLCLPRPFKVVYPESTKPVERHPHQYKTQKYEGSLSVQIDRAEEFKLENHSGIRIEGVATGKSHVVRYKLNGKEFKAFKVKFENSSEILVVEQGAYEGEFRPMPEIKKCPYELTVSMK